MPEIDSDHVFGFDTLSVHAGQRPQYMQVSGPIPLPAHERSPSTRPPPTSSMIPTMPLIFLPCNASAISIPAS